MKEYSQIELEVIKFESEDVITTSNCTAYNTEGGAGD